MSLTDGESTDVRPDIDKLREEYQAVKAAKAAQYREQTAWLTDAQINNLLRVEWENAKCEGCRGIPCRKDSMKYMRRIATFDEQFRQVYLAHKYCEHYRTYIGQKSIEKNFRSARIPLRYLGKTFTDYRQDVNNADAVEWAKWIVEEAPDNGLLLYGKPGCGKTFLAAIIAQELIRQGRTVIFGDVPSIMNDLKSTFDGNSEHTFDELMRELTEADLLVLDDIGTEYSTAWSATQLYTVVNTRYNLSKPILATTNYGAAELKEVFKGDVTGTRIVSRLCQMCEPVRIGGGDRRLGTRN